MAGKRKKEEILDVVDEKDLPRRRATMTEVYEKKLTHRIVHIFLLDANGRRVYLQKRAMTKSFLPGYYCTSAGGHVHAGETYIQAARRELREELGIRCRLRSVDKFTYLSKNHARNIKVFTGVTNKKASFTDGEVMSGDFFSINKAKKIVSKGKKVHPQLKECFKRLDSQNIFDIPYLNNIRSA